MFPDNDMIYDAVTEADIEESLLMFKTRAGQVNAVFACFGSAAQHAQHLEEALADFLSEYNKLAKRAISSQEFEVLDKKLQKKTLGRLLKEFSKYVTIKDTKVVKFLEMALEKRNFLMHHFFRDRKGRLRLEKSRLELLSELTGIGGILQEAAIIIDAMRIAMSEAIANSEHGSEQSDEEPSKVLFTATVEMPDDDSPSVEA